MGISVKGVSEYFEKVHFKEFQVFIWSDYTIFIAFLYYSGNSPCSIVPNACFILDVFTYYRKQGVLLNSYNNIPWSLHQQPQWRSSHQCRSWQCSWWRSCGAGGTEATKTVGCQRHRPLLSYHHRTVSASTWSSPGTWLLHRDTWILGFRSNWLLRSSCIIPLSPPPSFPIRKIHVLVSLIPRPLPAFQRSREKQEGLVCDGM